MRATTRAKGDRLRVAVLMGGPSGEHEVSIQGGQNVVSALSPGLYDVRPVVIGRDGPWRMPPPGWGRTDDAGPGFDARDVDAWQVHEGPCEALSALRAWGADVAVPVLHGAFGEDGTLQACLTAARIPYVGSGIAASATAFDKARTKALLRFHGIDTPAFRVVRADDLLGGRPADAKMRHIESWIDELGLPLVLKNPCGGSTLEVRIVHDAGEAVRAIEELMPPAEHLLVEEHVAGRELTVGVVEDRESRASALPVVEIRPRNGSFFDYHEKYAADGAEELCPAPIPEDVASRAQGLGMAVHRLLGLRGLSRTDLFLTETGQLTVLEVNTLPGMSARGLLPLAAHTSGVPFPDLVANLIRTAHL